MESLDLYAFISHYPPVLMLRTHERRCISRTFIPCHPRFNLELISKFEEETYVFIFSVLSRYNFPFDLITSGELTERKNWLFIKALRIDQAFHRQVNRLYDWLQFLDVALKEREGSLPLELWANELEETDEGVFWHLRPLHLNLYYLLSQLYLCEYVENLNKCGILIWRCDYRFRLVDLLEELADVLAVGC